MADAQGAYGDRLATAFGTEPASAISASSLGSARILVTHLQCDGPCDRMTRAVPTEAAFSIMLHRRALPSHKLWLDGRLVHSGGYAAGTVSIAGLEQSPVAYLGSPFDNVQFYISRAALDALAAEEGVRRIDTLDWTRGTHDPVLGHLADALRPALEQPGQAKSLYIDHVLLAAQAHIAHAYGGMRSTVPSARGGLAPWQERRAKELIHARLEEDVSLAELADACELSRSYFSRAFKQSVGVTPYQWLVQRRVERAQELMLESEHPLADIALASGFSDQSHFTRVFSGMVKVSPARWRREQRI
jgi:AraC family transcriptional regulator